LAASFEEQAAYQSAVPNAHSPNEVANQWGDWVGTAWRHCWPPVFQGCRRTTLTRQEYMRGTQRVIPQLPGLSCGSRRGRQNEELGTLRANRSQSVIERSRLVVAESVRLRHQLAETLAVTRLILEARDCSAHEFDSIVMRRDQSDLRASIKPP